MISSKFFVDKNSALKTNGLRWFWNITPIIFSPQFNGILTTVQKVFLQLNSMSINIYIVNTHEASLSKILSNLKANTPNDSIESETSRFYFFLLLLLLLLRLSLFNSTLSFRRAPAIFSCLSPIQVTCTRTHDSLCASASKAADTRSTKELKKTKQNKKPIWLESHTLICLNDLFSFCHFSLGREYEVRHTSECMMCDVRFRISVSFTTGIHMV